MSRIAAMTTRFGRALWWCGVPVFLTLWVLASQEAIFLRPSVFVPSSPLAAEIVMEYSFALTALAIAVTLTIWSHLRGTRTVRAESFLIPTCIAGLEACMRLNWFATCRGMTASFSALHQELHVGVLASVLMMAAPLVAAELLARMCPAGIAGPMPRSYGLATIAAIASVVGVWGIYEGLLSP